MKKQLIDIYIIDAGNAGFGSELQQIWPHLPSVINCRISRGSVYSHYLLTAIKDKKYPYRSISHSGQYCICGAGSISLGIDIELKRQIYPEWIPYGFSKDSLQFLHQWTACEAYFKMLNKKPESIEQVMFDSTTYYWENDFYIICLCVPKKTDICLRFYLAAGWKQWKELKDINSCHG